MQVAASTATCSIMSRSAVGGRCEARRQAGWQAQRDGVAERGLLVGAVDVGQQRDQRDDDRCLQGGQVVARADPPTGAERQVRSGREPPRSGLKRHGSKSRGAVKLRGSRCCTQAEKTSSCPEGIR
jgi:hypothetical protein